VLVPVISGGLRGQHSLPPPAMAELESEGLWKYGGGLSPRSTASDDASEERENEVGYEWQRP